VKTTVVLGGTTHSRMSAAASIAGKSHSAWMAEVIEAALKGLVIIDRRSSADQLDPSAEVDREEAA
jgi:hypothetical protein